MRGLLIKGLGFRVKQLEEVQGLGVRVYELEEVVDQSDRKHGAAEPHHVP